MKFLLFFVILTFALLGLSEFLHILRLKLILPKGKPNVRVVVSLEEKNALKQLEFVYEQYSWLGYKYADEIIALTDALSGETFSECKSFAKPRNIKIYCERKT